ncbi:MAG: flavodoxin domain-containing protein [Actinomycetota bacterium]
MEETVILVGTETGNAEDVAEELAAALEEAGLGTEVVDMEGAEPELLDGNRAVIVCTATHGDGELPENSMEFYERLKEERPDLSGVLFAVCALGDSVYPDFCEAGKIWSRFLKELGATEVIERYEIDGLPEEEDFEGAREWVREAAERFCELANERV